LCLPWAVLPRIRSCGRAAALALLATVFAILPAGSAHAQAATAEAISGRIFWGSTTYRGVTRFTRLVVWNARPGGSVFVQCCTPLRSVESPSVAASGFIDFTARVRRWRLREGDTLGIGILTRCGPQDADDDKCFPLARKEFSLIAYRRTPPEVFSRTCTYILPGQHYYRDLDCAAPCPPPPHLQFLDYCQGVGELLPPARFSVSASPARGGGVRISDFRIDGLPQQPPFDDPVIAVFCRGRGCPIGGAARFLVGSQVAGGSLQLTSLGRRPLRPGVTVEVVVLKGNFIGFVQRYTVTGNELAASSLCLYPTEASPRPCPPPPEVPPPPPEVPPPPANVGG
jgi:hypothetical protein